MTDTAQTSDEVEQSGDASVSRASGKRARRRDWLAAALVAVVAVVAATGVLLTRRPDAATPTPAPSPFPTPMQAPPTPPADAKALGLPKLLFGFYSAGIEQARCYGSCRPGDRDYPKQQATRARIADLRRMGVNYVVNNQDIAQRFRRNPEAYYALLAELHRNGIRVSYSVADDTSLWYENGRFDATAAERRFALTDLDGNGVSDLDGRLDVLYQGHEVMEYATHRDRVRMYRVAKKWFPTTPVSVYYGGFMRPFETPGGRHPKGGTWGDYVYGPGETDIVHATVTTGGGGFEPTRFTEDVQAPVRIVQRLTPGVPVVLHTSFAGDDSMRSNAGSMWSPEKLRQWYRTMVSVPEVRGVLLRSYDRFTYDLANPAFSVQRATWAELGADAARRNDAAPAR